MFGGVGGGDGGLAASIAHGAATYVIAGALLFFVPASAGSLATGFVFAVSTRIATYFGGGISFFTGGRGEVREAAAEVRREADRLTDQVAAWSAQNRDLIAAAGASLRAANAISAAIDSLRREAC